MVTGTLPDHKAIACDRGWRISVRDQEHTRRARSGRKGKRLDAGIKKDSTEATNGRRRIAKHGFRPLKLLLLQYDNGNHCSPALPSRRRAKDQNASGDLGVYDTKTKTIMLTGNVVISQGKNVVRGERVVVDTTTGDARVESGVTAHDPAKSGVTAHDRVRVLIVPAKDAKGAPTNTMTFEEAPSHPP